MKLDKLEVYDPTEFDITMTATLSQDGVAVRLDYWPATLTADFVESIGQTFQAVVDSLMSDQNRSIGELDLISAADTSWIHSWNELEPPGAASVCIHEVIAQQALARRDSPAICSWDGDFIYHDLERLSDDFTFYLVDIGVQAEAIVPIYIEKSAWAIIALPSVLKPEAGLSSWIQPIPPAGWQTLPDLLALRRS